jgi:hypothetical protein
VRRHIGRIVDCADFTHKQIGWPSSAFSLLASLA